MNFSTVSTASTTSQTSPKEALDHSTDTGSAVDTSSKSPLRRTTRYQALHLSQEELGRPEIDASVPWIAAKHVEHAVCGSGNAVPVFDGCGGVYFLVD